MSIAQFHLAFSVHDLEEARAFYVGLLGCTMGRETWNHLDFNMHGHQVVAHLGPNAPRAWPSEFDGHEVPVPHFGLNLDRAAWQALAQRLKQSRCHFREYPHTRLAGQLGEHDTMFIYDPSGNALELKSFRDPSQVFAIDPELASTAPAPDSEDVLRPRIEATIHRVRGSVEEGLLATGFLDSIAVIELVVELQRDLGIKLDLQLTDFSSIATLVAAIGAVVRAQRGASAA
jgi:uncharacterized protein